MAARLSRALALVVLLASAGCTTRAVVTSSEMQGGDLFSSGIWLREELYFGLSIPDGGVVTDSAFNAFVTNEVATRLPAGFTVLSGIGYWRGATGQTIREPSRVLILHYRDTEREKARALTDIIATYKRVFRQESVLRVTVPVRVAF